MRKLLLYAAIMASLFACNEKRAELEPQTPPVSPNQISISQANELLGEVGNKLQTKSGTNSPLVNIASIDPINNDQNEPVCFVVSYKGGGFVILSADNRLEPVLAFSEDENFTTNSTDINPGLVHWIDNVKSGINGIRVLNKPQTEVMAANWTPEAIGRIFDHPQPTGPHVPMEPEVQPEYPPIPTEPVPCNNHTVYEMGPYITTEWHQGYPYNNNAPYIRNGSTSERAAAGCTSIAVAQVIAYYKYPDRYNWSSTIDQARLIRDVGDAVHTNYGLSTSSAAGEDMAPALENIFNYSRANYSDYNLQTVTGNLIQGRPIVFTGGSKGGGWLNPKYENGHAWVCDGYKIVSPCSAHSHSDNSHIPYLHMNWGWGGGQGSKNG